MAETTGKLASEYPAATLLIAYGHFSGKGCVGAMFDDWLTVMGLKNGLRTFCSEKYRLNSQATPAAFHLHRMFCCPHLF